jgi:hypothetical protein
MGESKSRAGSSYMPFRWQGRSIFGDALASTGRLRRSFQGRPPIGEGDIHYVRDSRRDCHRTAAFGIEAPETELPIGARGLSGRESDVDMRGEYAQTIDRRCKGRSIAASGPRQGHAKGDGELHRSSRTAGHSGLREREIDGCESSCMFLVFLSRQRRRRLT